MASAFPSPPSLSADAGPDAPAGGGGGPDYFLEGRSDFYSYPSFDGTHLLAKIEKLAPEVCADAEWMAVEKIHGANFSVTFPVDSNEIVYASRNGYLADTAKFFNHLGVLERHLPAIKAMVEEVRSMTPGVRVQLFGELFGGGVQNVNVVYYSPVPDFIAFDLFVDRKPQPSAVLRSLCEKHGVPVLEVLHTGKLKDLLQLDPAFESQLRLQLGHELPKEYHGKSNLAEGYVLSPMQPLTVRHQRIMTKHKNPAHLEVKVKQPKPPKPATSATWKWEEMPPDLQALLTKARGYVTLNRLGNYLSKQGEFIPTKAPKYATGLMQDAYTDLQKDVDAAEQELMTKHQFLVRTYSMNEAKSVLDEYIASLKK